MDLNSLTHIVTASFDWLAGLDTPGVLWGLCQRFPGGLCQRFPEGTQSPRHPGGALPIPGEYVPDR